MKPGIQYYRDFDYSLLKGIDKIDSNLKYPYITIEENDSQLLLKTVYATHYFHQEYQKGSDFYFQADTVIGDMSVEHQYDYWKDGIEYHWKYLFDYEETCPKICLQVFSWRNGETSKQYVFDCFEKCNQPKYLLKFGPYIPIIDTSLLFSVSTTTYKRSGNILTIESKGLNSDETTMYETKKCYVLRPPYFNWHYAFGSPYNNQIDCETHKAVTH